MQGEEIQGDGSWQWAEIREERQPKEGEEADPDGSRVTGGLEGAVGGDVDVTITIFEQEICLPHFPSIKFKTFVCIVAVKVFVKHLLKVGNTDGKYNTVINKIH